MLTSCSGCGYGNAFSRVASTTLKITVVAPMPSAIVITAINANAGALRSCRRANLKSFISFAPESLEWIDFRSASCRDIAGQQGHYCEEGTDAGVGERVGWCSRKKQTR